MSVPPPLIDPPAPAPEARPAIQIFSPQECKGLWSIMGDIWIWLATSKQFNIPTDIARKTLAYTPEEQEDLAEPTAAMVNKYMPDWMGEYSEESKFGMAFLQVHMCKFNRLRAEVARQSRPQGVVREERVNGQSEPIDLAAQ